MFKIEDHMWTHGYRIVMSGDKISGRSLDHDPFVMDDAAGFSH